MNMYMFWTACPYWEYQDSGKPDQLFKTFEELKLPIKGPVENHDAGVIKLYEPSSTGLGPAAAGRQRSCILDCFPWQYIVVFKFVKCCCTTSLRCFACDVLGDLSQSLHLEGDAHPWWPCSECSTCHQSRWCCCLAEHVLPAWHCWKEASRTLHRSGQAGLSQRQEHTSSYCRLVKKWLESIRQRF